MAIPLLVIGLYQSELAPITPGGAQEGNSILSPSKARATCSLCAEVIMVLS